MPDIKLYDDYRAMERDCDLIDLVTYELSGIRNGAGIGVDADEDPDSEELELEAQVYARLMDSQTVFEVRHRVHVNGIGARYTVDLGVIFEFPQKSKFEKSAQQEFLSNVALMVLHPHLREALHGLSTRMGVEPVLLPLRRGYDLGPMDPSESDLDLRLESHT